MITSQFQSQATPSEPGLHDTDERLLRLTARAAGKIRALQEQQGQAAGVLRVGVVGGGCSGFSYQMDFEDAPRDGDFRLDSQGIRVVVDSRSAVHLVGTEVDYVDALQGGGFKFHNPNATSTCSCGESFCS